MGAPRETARGYFSRLSRSWRHTRHKLFQSRADTPPGAAKVRQNLPSQPGKLPTRSLSF